MSEPERIVCQWYVRDSSGGWSRERCGRVAVYRSPRGPRWLCPAHAETDVDDDGLDPVARERARAAVLRGLG